MRALQEWMGHRDFKTTLNYAPSTQERELVQRAFGRGSNTSGKIPSEGSGPQERAAPGLT
jgi:hypothetical protein